jgi:hypothetical protein
VKGEITHYDLCSRCHVNIFSQRLFEKFGRSAQRTHKLGSNNLGRSWSGFIYRRDQKNWLVLFDSDDGTGGTPADCKIVWSNFQGIVNEFQVSDYVIFKAQFANLPEQAQHYPFKWDVYPTAIMADDPRHTHELAKSLQKHDNPEIDVLFVGGRVHENNKPYCWPKNRDISQWWVGNRRIGYEKLLSIKNKRRDLNIIAVDDLLVGQSYYDVVANSKICLDFPGVGQSSRKFFEFLVLEKCALSLQQQVTCWDLVPDKHYASLGFDFYYETLENKIDYLLTSNTWKTVSANTRELKSKLTHDFVIDYVSKTLDEHIDKKTNDCNFHVSYPR